MTSIFPSNDVAVADTSLLIAQEQGRPLRGELPEILLVSAITMGELRAGILAAGKADIRATRLATLVRASQVAALPVDDDVAEAWARLRMQIRENGRRMPVNDSWIAATAMAHGLPVATQDDDFDGVEGLTVIKL